MLWKDLINKRDTDKKIPFSLARFVSDYYLWARFENNPHCKPIY